jgi:TonB-linked SusC/RagA family outer membrane protein
MSSFTVFAQQKLTGTVIDANSEPIIGVSVIEKGTTNGVATDVDGKFSISVSKGAVLQISYIGYMTQEITVGERSHWDVVLEEDTKALDEVVVIGYGTIKKVDLTGAVASVGGKQLAEARATTLSQALQGTMPGVLVTRSGSTPGATATVRIRGITTIGNSEPLVLVDGTEGSLHHVDPEDVESISVLKDAASASIYGARAAAGVILITTKRAKDGQLSIDYSGTLGVMKATAFPGVVDYKRYMEMNNEVAWNDGENVPGNEYFVYGKDYIESYAENNRLDPDRYPITDWKSYLINNSAPRQKHGLSVTYGNKVIKTKASISYEKTDALYNRRSYATINARFNNSVTINKYLSATVDGSYRQAVSEAPLVNPMEAAYVYGPLWTPAYSDGRISGGRNGTNTYARLNYGGFSNEEVNYVNARIALNFTPVKGLTVTGVWAPRVGYGITKTFVKQVPYYDLDDPTLFAGYINGCVENSLTEGRNHLFSTTKQLLANYAVTFGKAHELSLLAGYEDYHYFIENLTASSNVMELVNFPYLDRGNKNYLANSGSANENAYRSYFGRINYSYGDRYLFQANIRTDQSSRFHRDYRTGYFPSVSVGWVVTEEPFLKNKLGPLSFLKLRGSWGNLGNERVGNYPYQAIMAFSTALMVNGSNAVQSVTTAGQQTLNVEDITWERTEALDVGVDAYFLKNRLSLTFDYYKKTTHDMLLSLEVPDFMGYNNPQQNAGVMNTKGWDLQVEWKDKIGDFRYSISANLSDYRSVMGNLEGTVFDGNTIIKEGSEYAEYYGYVSDGLFLTQADLDASAKLSSAVRVGDIKFTDISGPDGVPDGIISPDYDRVLLGGSLPRYTYGGAINAGYKDFDLSITFNGVGKQKRLLSVNQVYQTAQWYTFPDFIDGNYFSHYNTDEQNAKATYPRLSQVGYNGNNYKMSDYWLIDGSYFRLKNIVLGYTLPKAIVRKVQLSNVRVWAGITDLFSIDNQPKGWDPEAGLSAYIAKTFNFGIQVKF